MTKIYEVIVRCRTKDEAKEAKISIEEKTGLTVQVIREIDTQKISLKGSV